MDIIERAARALIDADPAISGHHKLHIEMMKPTARIVLDAIREPDEGMIEAGGEKVFSGSRSAALVGAKNAWQAMIDKALKG